MAEVQLHGKVAAGRVALVDDDDLELVSAYRWRIYEYQRLSGGIDGPYAMAHTYRDGRRTTIRMHQVIMGQAGIDHANRDGLDNRRQNLRPATGSQNNVNQGKQTGTLNRFIGVCWHKRHCRWIANIRYEGRVWHLGYFDDEVEAARARDRAAIKFYGEFASLNFPQSVDR